MLLKTIMQTLLRFLFDKSVLKKASSVMFCFLLIILLTLVGLGFAHNENEVSEVVVVHASDNESGGIETGTAYVFYDAFWDFFDPWRFLPPIQNLPNPPGGGGSGPEDPEPDCKELLHQLFLNMVEERMIWAKIVDVHENYVWVFTLESNGKEFILQPGDPNLLENIVDEHDENDNQGDDIREALEENGCFE